MLQVFLFFQPKLLFDINRKIAASHMFTAFEENSGDLIG